MNLALLILGSITVGAAVAAMSLRNVVHCLLWLVVSFVGLAGLYLSLSATFVGLTQVLVYLGAVAILSLWVLYWPFWASYGAFYDSAGLWDGTRTPLFAVRR